MKLHHYNEAYAYMVRRAKFANGTPPPKPERSFSDKLKTLKNVSQGISPESRIRLLDYFIQEALQKNQITKEQASGIYNQLQLDKDKIRKQRDDYETGNFNDPFRTEREEFAVGGMPYEIFGKKIDIPLIPGVMSGAQNKKSVEEGFKKLEKWLEDPTPERWNKIFGTRNAFGYQLRNYLLGKTGDLPRGDLIGNVKGMPTATKVLDAIDVKNLLTKSQINKINELTIGGKGKSLKSIAAKTFGNLKFSMDEVIETIKNFQNGEQWLRRNPDPNKIGPDGKNIYRKYANAIKSMQSEQKRIGGFPFGDNSEKKLWANLYRSSYRGDRIKIVGEFADGNLPINKDGKIDWKMTNKDGVPAWKRVQFIDTQAPKNKIFTWGDNFKRGDFKKQIDDVFGQGFFDKSTAAYDVQVKTGSKRDFTKEGGGRTIKSDLKIALLKNEALLKNPKATKKEIDDYVSKRAKRFNITEVHHPDGVGANPYKTEPVFRYANRALDLEVMQPLKAGKIDINEAKLRIDKINKNIGPIRTLLDDGYYGNYVNTQKSIIKAAKDYRVKSIAKLAPGVTTADQLPIPEKTKTRDMFKKAFTTGAKTAGKVIKPLGIGFGVNAVKTAITKAADQGLDLNFADKVMAFDSGDAEIALNNARRRVDPEFAAQERAKDLAQMTDDFEEVGQSTFGKFNDQIKNIKLP